MSGIDRVDEVRRSTALTGIDFVQVSDDQLELLAFFLHDELPPAVLAALTALDPAAVQIHALGPVAPERVRVVQNLTPLPLVDGRRALRLRVAERGGFGHYRLHIADPVIDPYFNDIRFSFKAGCDSELDCTDPPHRCPPGELVDFPVDYRARDFWSIRQALLDFAAQRYPDWQDRLEADLGMVLVELMSALGDELAYAQDRIRRETRLGTASQRRSLRHLARLVDYPLDEGSGAFAWLDLQVNAAGAVAAGTAVRDARGRTVFEIGRGLADTGKAFQLSPQRNQFAPHPWDEDLICLSAGSTRLTLSGHHSADLVPEGDIDPVGKWVLLATQPTDPSRPERRWMARVVSAADAMDPLLALPITEIAWDAPTPFELDLETLVVRANLLPTTSGKTRSLRFRIGPAADPADPDAGLPRALERVGINSALSYDAEDGRVKFLFSLPGSEATPLVWLPAGEGYRPELELIREGDGPWGWLPSLVGEETAAPTAKAFTLEDGHFRRVAGFERLGRLTVLEDYAGSAGATLRFGDGELGLAPTDGSVFSLRYRLGNGRLMNLAADTLTHFEGGPPGFVDSITNPLPATGGRDPEETERIRINAPQAFRALTQRAVRPEDHEEIAERLPWVQQAGAKIRWTGSWPTVLVTPDPRDRVGLAADQRRELERTLDRARMAGREVKVPDPRYANLDLEVQVCVAPNAYRGEVKGRVLRALFGEDGQGGFFDPDHFTFGTPLSRADLIAAIQAVPGVRAVEAMRVRRRGWFDWRPFEEFTLGLAPDELLRVANDPLLPERGAVRLIMEGGA